MASDITISAFSAVPGVGQVALAATWAAPAGQSCLPYMQATKIRFFRNTTNNAAAATQIGESTVGILVYETTVTYWYFAAAVDPAGNEGARSAGVQAVPKTATPGPNSIGTSQLQDGAVTAGKMTVGTLSAITADLGTITAGSVTGITFTGGTFRTAVSGRRVEITGADNYLRAYNSSNVEVGRFGQSTIGQTVLSIDVGADSSSTAASMRSSGSGPSVYAENAGSGRAVHAVALGASAAIYGRNNSSNSGAHCGLFQHGNGGGTAVVGVSPTDGQYAFYASIGGYGPFTGSHDGFVRKGHGLKAGDLVVDKRVMFRNGVNDVVTEVERASRRADRRVAGVVARVVPFDPEGMLAVLPLARFGEAASFVRRHLAETYDRVIFNAVGEGQITVCGRGGDITAGDYVQSSDLAGCAERQCDTRGSTDYRLKAWTVAQIREDVTFDEPDQSRLAACFYRCG